MNSLRPKKSLGQHFLIDPNIREKILGLARLSTSERVVEIGPGKGFLTEALLREAGEVLALEIDPRCLSTLRERFSGRTGFQLVEADALSFDYETLRPGYTVVSNLPYYLSSPILFRLLDEKDRIRRMVLMFQREVAERITSPPGTRRYGVLSVAVQFRCEVRPGFRISPNCFRPRPKVESAVLVLTPRAQPPVSVHDEAFFLGMVRKIFTHRRKVLKNALIDGGFPERAVNEALASCGLDLRRRPETLGLPELALLADRLFEKTRGL